MKKIKTHFETILILITLLLNIAIYGQSEVYKENIFVLVYNLEGKKINKGKIIAVTDSTLQLKRPKGIVIINAENIGFIKTKRSAGNNVLMGGVIGASTASIISIASIDPDDGFIIDLTPNSFGEALTVGMVFGGVAGSAVGALTIMFKKSNTFVINGNFESLSVFKKSIYN